MMSHAHSPVAVLEGARHPGHKGMAGRYARLISLDVMTHAQDLFEAFRKDRTGEIWASNPVGPFNTASGLRDWIDGISGIDAQPCFAVIDKETGRALGIASFLHIQPAHALIDIGAITFAPDLQRTRIATEAIYLMMNRALNELGYHRLGWRCEAHNTPARAAAERFGFRLESVGDHDDTAAYAMTNRDWPALERGFRAWLEPENFETCGQQRRKLADLIMAERAAATQKETSA